MLFSKDVVQGVKIEVENTTKSFHTVTDWDLAIVNTDCIGEPEQETTYINIPYSDTALDISEAVSGRPIYKKREIKIKLKGFRNRLLWDKEISKIRNQINGRVCRITFDNDTSFFWRGRVEITDYSRHRECAYFTISLPNAEPYKYAKRASDEAWLWDSFNFLTDNTLTTADILVDGTKTISIISGNMLVAPKFIVTLKESDSFTVTDGNHTLSLIMGENYDPRILVNGEDDVELTFTGSGKVTVSYRGGSL